MQLFPPEAWLACERCYVCDLNTVGSMTHKKQLEDKEKAKLLEVECVHCAVTVHNGCRVSGANVDGWDLFCSCDVHTKERKKQERKERRQEKTLFYPCCLSCKLSSKWWVSVQWMKQQGEGESEDDEEECCNYCLQCVTGEEVPFDPTNQRSILLASEDPAGKPCYVHSRCQDFDKFGHRSNNLVVGGGKREKKCKAPDCGEPWKEDSKVVKCAVASCSFVVHPSCIDTVAKTNVITMWTGDEDDDERPTEHVRHLPRRELDPAKVRVLFYCPEHKPADEFDGDAVKNLMSARWPIRIGELTGAVEVMGSSCLCGSV